MNSEGSIDSILVAGGVIYLIWIDRGEKCLRQILPVHVWYHFVGSGPRNRLIHVSLRRV